MSSKRVLFVASVTSHILKFHIPYLKYFHENGYEVHVASFGEEKIPYCDRHFSIPFERSPFKLRNFEAYRLLHKLINEMHYDIIECNTPMASVLTRLASAEARVDGTRLIYMAHGFHFFKGAPWINWMMYYPIEKNLSKFTDDIITINEEDYQYALRKFKAKHIHHVYGVGIDENMVKKRLSNEEKDKLRMELKINENEYILFFAGELNKNKNQIAIIKAFQKLNEMHPDTHLLLAGIGPLEGFLKEQIQRLHLENHVSLLGYRNDVPKILQITNLYVSMSKREGLPVNILEARLFGLPIIVSDVRGQRELIHDGENGVVIKTNDIDSLAQKMMTLYENRDLANQYASQAKENLEPYFLEQVYESMVKIYQLKEEKDG